MDLGRLLARLVRLAAGREAESPEKPDMESAQACLGTSGCIETVLSRSHVHVPTWKEISHALCMRVVALISRLWGWRWGTHLILDTQVGFEEL